MWRDTRGLDCPALAELIRCDRIDVLVDLTGHLAADRLLAFARRPAPVQVTYLGYPGTTGMRSMATALPTRYTTGRARPSNGTPNGWCGFPVAAGAMTQASSRP